MEQEKLADMMLKNKEIMFQKIMDNAPVGLATLTIGGKFIQVNPAFCRIIGYSEEELEGMNYNVLTCKEDQPIDHLNVKRLLQNEIEFYKLEKRYIRKDSTMIWVQVTRSILKDLTTNKPVCFIAQVEDISERKRLEKSLKESEERFRNIMESAAVGIATVSTDGQIIQINDAFCNITGYEKAELKDLNYKKLTYAEDRSIDSDNVQKLLEGKIPSYRLEKRYVRKDNKIIWVQVTRSLLKDAATGAPLYFIAQIEDITHRKQTEKALHESEALFRNIIDNAPVGIAAVSIEGQFLHVNQSLCNITGYKSEKLKQITYQELTYPEDLAANIIKVQELLAGKLSIFSKEKRYICKNNRIIWVEVTQSILRDSITEKPLYFIAQVEDITERKHLANELKKSAEEIANLYEYAPCGYHSLDDNGFFVRMNITELQWLGYTHDEVIGKIKFTDLLTPESLLIFQENFEQFKEQGFIHDVELQMARKDGSTFTVIMSATGDKTSGGHYAMSRSTMFNITDRKRTEHALQESEARFRNIMDNAPIGMAIISLAGLFLDANRALCEITGYKKDELEKLVFNDLLVSEGLAIDEANTRQFSDEKSRYYKLEKQGIRKDGTLVWLEVTRSILRDVATGESLQFIVQVEDITERINSHEKINQLAYHDILTGLPNRQLLLDRLHQAIAEAKRDRSFLAILFIDLDKFKYINDTLGHHIGDALLKKVASRLSRIIRDSDTIARTGGDEFIIVLTQLNTPDDSAAKAEKIIEAMKNPMSIQGNQIQIAASIGIATYPTNGEDVAELMKKADMAMYQAKDAGGDQYHFYYAH